MIVDRDLAPENCTYCLPAFPLPPVKRIRFPPDLVGIVLSPILKFGSFSNFELGGTIFSQMKGA